MKSDQDKNDYTQYMRQASIQYLIDYLPDDWEAMGEGSDDPDSPYDLQYMWLEENAWELFEDYRGKDIYEFIDNAARELERNAKGSNS